MRVGPRSEGVTLVAGGERRTYLLHRPSTVRPGPPALVIVLHGASLTADQTETYYRWDELADREGFAVAYPQGLGKAWNAGSCCSGAPARGTDDVGFVNTVIDDASRRVGADPRRLYLSGVSNGAMLTFRYACEHPGRLAAIGSVAGTLTASCDHPPVVPLIEIHGLHDRAVPYLPGAGTQESGPALRLPARESIDRWRSADGCHDPKVVTTGAVHVETSVCAPGADVKVITIDGAGHQWPGAVLDPARSAYDGPEDQPDTHVNATQELWAFFADHIKS
ncbi:MAG: PHB depolymerase family esterase [Acidimicrobiales bacterium]